MYKIKVVWICHFVNAEIQERLPIKKKSSEMAPWISLLIEEFKGINEIELHVISPFRWLKKDFNLFLDGVHYYFIKTGMPIVHRHWPSFFRFDFWTNFYFNRKKIKKIVTNINPDIINLHGIENSYYSTTIFELKGFPILVTIQGLHSLGVYNNNSSFSNFQKKNEQNILKEFNNYGIRARFLEGYIKNINPIAKFYWFNYPFDTSISNYNIKEDKKHDCIFFARISRDKGIEDLIEAIHMVKDAFPNIVLKIIGACSKDYERYLKQKIKALNLRENIIFTGFINNRLDVHKEVAKSKITVLPTYNDILPGTIIESLKIGTPVIAYAANGVVDFNNYGEIIKLVKVGDVITLAKQIITLLTDNSLRLIMGKKGIEFAIKYFNNKNETNKIISAYNETIKTTNIKDFVRI